MTALADDPELALAIALAREVLHRSGPLLVSVALDRAQPALIECPRLRAIVVREADGERELSHDTRVGVDLPELPVIRQLPPMEVDPESGEVAGVIGGLEMLARALRDVAALLPGASVIAAEYETSDPGATLGLAARSGEPVVVLLGDREFELEV